MNQRDLNIFERRLGPDRIGFTFIGPGTALGSEYIRVEFTEGRWRLTHEDSTDAITEEHEYQLAALLKIVARRCGFEADLRLIEEEFDQ